MIKVVIFDLDGTLVNAYRAVYLSVNHVLKVLNFPQQSYVDIKAAVGLGDKQLLAHYVGDENKTKAIKLYRAHHEGALVAKGGVIFLPQVKTLLAHLKKQGYILVIATNRPEKFTHIILKKLSMTHYFDMVLCADKTKMPKPNPGMLLKVIKHYKVFKSQVLFVGDMDIDVNTGKKAGINTVAVATGSTSLSKLKILHPYRIINRIGQLNNIIKE